MGNVLVLHTTEGTSFSGAKSWLTETGNLSHWLCDPKTGVIDTLLESNKPGRSLKNLSGGVETNNRPGVYQMEIVGKAAEVPDYDDEWYQQLAVWVNHICRSLNIPLIMPYRFAGSEAYGTKGVVRLTNQEWLKAEGIIGHQHVPENAHWDPGEIGRLKNFLDVNPKTQTQAMSRDEAEKFVSSLYSITLDRAPDTTGGNYWVNIAVNQGAMVCLTNFLIAAASEITSRRKYRYVPSTDAVIQEIRKRLES